MNLDVLTVDSIEKQFQTQKAVDRLSFRVRRGEIFALLGPNGAGKTTSIRMLLNIIKPDSGSIVFSLNGSSAPLASRLGYLPEDRGLYKDVAVTKTLEYMGVLRGLSRKEAATRVAAWLERVGLADRATEKLEALSKGNQQKVQFVSAILHEPDFAILDEPFAGLDPLNQDFFLEIIRELRDRGTTILLCAHQMALVERLADRVLLMNRGREVLSGSLAEIRRNFRAAGKVIVTVPPATDPDLLRELPAVERVDEISGAEFVCLLKPDASLPDFLKQAVDRVALLDVRTARVDLHEIFVQAVGADAPSADRESQP